MIVHQSKKLFILQELKVTTKRISKNSKGKGYHSINNIIKIHICMYLLSPCFTIQIVLFTIIIITYDDHLTNITVIELVHLSLFCLVKVIKSYAVVLKIEVIKTQEDIKTI